MKVELTFDGADVKNIGAYREGKKGGKVRRREKVTRRAGEGQKPKMSVFGRGQNSTGEVEPPKWSVGSGAGGSKATEVTSCYFIHTTRAAGHGNVAFPDGKSLLR